MLRYNILVATSLIQVQGGMGMYLFDQISEKLRVIQGNLRRDISKLQPDEWKEWRMYNLFDVWLKSIPSLKDKDERYQLNYLLGMEFLFITILEAWEQKFSREINDPLLQQYLLKIIEVMEILRKNLNIEFNGHAELLAEYYCKNCKSFYYHKDPFLAHCYKCEAMIDFMGITPVEKIFTGFSNNRITPYYDGVPEAVSKIDL